MKKICFPTDFSELSIKNLPVALSLTEKLHAELHLIHVITSEISLISGDNLLEDEHQKSAEAHFTRIKENHTSPSDNIHITCLRGDIVDETNKYCSHNAIDLLFVSTHGYSGLKKIILGSIANKFIRHATVPVCISNPEKQAGFNMNKVENVFVPTDFSDHSNSAIEFGIGLTKKLGASLCLLHVLTNVNEWVGIYGDAFSIVGQYGSFNGFLKEQEKEAKKKIDQLTQNILNKHPEITVVNMVLEGPADEAIVEQCACDVESLIVMSTHGYSGLDKYILGSVAERVIQHSSIPVITLKPQEDQT